MEQPHADVETSDRRSHCASKEAPVARATVVIPTLNEAANIEHTLQSVCSQSIAELLVLVVDGGSTDGTCDTVARIAAHDARVHLLHNPRRLQSAALNLGLAAARTDILVRLDGHAAIGVDYVERILDTFERTEAAGVGGRMEAVPGHSAKQRGMALANGAPWGAGPAVFHRGGMPGPAETVYLGSYRVDVLRSLGGWDEAMPINEDYELNHRLRASGHTLWFEPDLVVSYHPRPTYRALARQYFRYGRGKADTLRRHPKSLRIRQLLPALGIPGAIGALARFGVAGAAGIGLTHGSVLVALAAKAEPRDLPGAAHGAFAAFVMHWSWSAGLWTGVVLESPRSPDSRSSSSGSSGSGSNASGSISPVSIGGRGRRSIQP